MSQKEYKLSFNDIFMIIKMLLHKEKKLYGVLIIYSAFISVLNLAIPTSAQHLIDSVTHTSMLNPVIYLGLLLFLLLLLYGIFKLMSLYVIEIFKRKFFARMSADIMMKVLFAEHSFFESRNKLDYCNRFFDIAILQRRVPELLIGGLTFIQQLVIGLVVISLYHLYLMLFSLIFIICLYFICRVYGMRAANASIAESYAKYDVAAWLEDVARMHTELKSNNNADFVVSKTDNLIHSYLNSRVRFFGIFFLQNVLIYLMFAGLGTTFFIAGGILVIRGQITIGQLIASELMIMGILTSVAGMYKMLDAFYELCSASKKVGTFYNIPTECRKGISNFNSINFNDSSDILNFKNVKIFFRDKNYCFDFSFGRGKVSLICVANSNSELVFCNAIMKFMSVSSGEINYLGVNLKEISSTALRDEVMVINSDKIYESTILEYLTNNDKNISVNLVSKALELVMLSDSSVKLSPDTRLFGEGYPLSKIQVVRLKVAKAFILKPSILILTNVFDQIKVVRRNMILNYMKQYLPGTMVIYFSNRKDFVPRLFDRYMFLRIDSMIEFRNIAELASFESKYYIEYK